MGSIYAKGVLRSHFCKMEDIAILEKSKDRHKHLEGLEIGIIHDRPDECVGQSDLIILAVKPQDSSRLFASIAPFVMPQQVILSIMAGISIATISNGLNNHKVIRAMPNLPAQIGMGMTVFTSTNEVTRLELVMVQNLLSTTGKTVYVAKEQMIDAATAISGSGPAYVFFFMKAIMSAAEEMGFSEAESELLIIQTFKGAVDVYNKSSFSLDEWITKVSSKGGTTEAAIEVFESDKLFDRIKNGTNAALQRAIKLRGDSNKNTQGQ